MLQVVRRSVVMLRRIGFRLTWNTYLMRLQIFSPKKSKRIFVLAITVAVGLIGGCGEDDGTEPIEQAEQASELAQEAIARGQDKLDEAEDALRSLQEELDRVEEAKTQLEQALQNEKERRAEVEKELKSERQARLELAERLRQTEASLERATRAVEDETEASTNNN